jgi:hypothetical protein
MKNTHERIGIFGIDTAVVLFFLAAEYTRSVRILSPDAGFMAVTIGMVLVLPYFLPSGLRAPNFGSWMIGRSVVLLAGLVAGAILSQSVGIVVPAGLRYAPMTFLILASMISCYVQFYGLMKLRLVK